MTANQLRAAELAETVRSNKQNEQLRTQQNAISRVALRGELASNFLNGFQSLLGTLGIGSKSGAANFLGSLLKLK